MKWKIGYGWIGLITITLSIFLVIVEMRNAPVQISPSIEITKTSAQLNPYPELEGLVVHVNSASVEQLQQLPGIGPTKANAIYNYIRQFGNLLSIEDLLEIPGIGESTLEQIKAFISIAQ